MEPPTPCLVIRRANGGYKSCTATPRGTALLRPSVMSAGSSDGPETKVRDWANAQLDEEVNRVTASGAKVIKLFPKNCGVVRPEGEKHCVNRVEFSTGLDFDTVEQIMLSDDKPVPEKPGFALRFVVLSTGKPIMLMCAYIYDTGFAGNLLQDWQLINSKLKSSRHRIESLDSVT